MSVYQVDTEGGSYEVTTDEVQQPSGEDSFESDAISGAGKGVDEEFGKNAIKDAVGIINPLNAASMLKEGLWDIPKAAAQSSVDLLKGSAKAISGGGLPDDFEQAVKDSPLVQETAKMTEPIAKDPLGYAYKHPVSTAMLAAAPFGAFAPEAAEVPIPQEPVEVPETPTTIPVREGPEPQFQGASQVPPDPNAPPPAPKAPPPNAPPSSGMPFANEAQEALVKAKEVKDYISRGYEGFSGKPGAISDVADYIQEKSQMMATQQMGATPLQARQIGHEGMRAIGQYALDNNIVGPTVGLKGMRQAQTALMEDAGKKIGAFRKAADAVRSPPTDAIDVLQAVRQKLDPIFARGSRSGEMGSYAKALEDVEDSKPTFEGIAETATKLNKAANEANRLNQPHGAFTDVANEISRINNERIKQLLGPQKAAQYEQALREFGVNKKIGEMLKRKEAGEVKRFGPGSVMSNLTQKAMDEFGYRTGAKVANKVSTSILKNPSIAKSLPSLFKEFTHQVEDVGHEVTGMSEGGMVSREMADFVGSR